MFLNQLRYNSVIIVGVYALAGTFALSACHSGSTDKLVSPLTDYSTPIPATPQDPQVDLSNISDINTLMASFKVCDKKIQSTEHGPVRYLSQSITIEAPENIQAPVNYVVV